MYGKDQKGKYRTHEHRILAYSESMSVKLVFAINNTSDMLKSSRTSDYHDFVPYDISI